MHQDKNILWKIRKFYYASLRWILIHIGIKQARVSCLIDSIIFELKLLAVVFISVFSIYTFIVATTEPTLTTLEIILKINGIFFLVIVFLIFKILYKFKNNSCGLHGPHTHNTHENNDEHK